MVNTQGIMYRLPLATALIVLAMNGCHAVLAFIPISTWNQHPGRRPSPSSFRAAGDGCAVTATWRGFCDVETAGHRNGYGFGYLATLGRLRKRQTGRLRPRRHVWPSCTRRWTHSGNVDADDQRVFWDTATEILQKELDDQCTDLSRVWDFVKHNRDGLATPASLPSSYRATGLYFPGLEAKPWWNRSKFPWLEGLEGAASDITREMNALARVRKGTSFASGTGEMSTVYDATKGWGTMRIRYMGRFSQPGINYALLPSTLSVLQQLPLAPETAAFQRQLPGTGLPLHVDPSNFILGCHLGVVIPEPVATISTSRDSEIGELQSARGHVGEIGFGGDARMKNNGGTGKKSGKANNSNGAAGKGFGQGQQPADSLSGDARENASGDADDKKQRDAQVDSRSSPTCAMILEEVLQDRVDSGAERASGFGDDKAEQQKLGDRGGGVTVAQERAWIEVAGEKRQWDEGRAFVFDPSFLHRTHNPTSAERIILNVDIWHPGLTDVEIAAIERVCKLVEQWNSRSGVFG